MDAPTRLLLTRPLPAAQRFLAALETAHGAPILSILSPVLAIRPVPLPRLERPAVLLLTSENGAGRLGELGFAGLPAWCVGPRTAAVARMQGAEVIEVSSEAEGLLAALLATRPAGPLLHLRGEHARGDLAERLRAAGLEAQDVVAYRQEALPPIAEAQVALNGPAPLVAPLFSPRSAALLAGWGRRAPLRVVALSRAVAEAAAPLRPDELLVAASPDGAAMVTATLRALTRPGPDAAATPARAP